MRYITALIFVVLAICYENDAVSKTFSRLIRTEAEGLKNVKRQILLTADEMNATDKEKAIVLAIASIETENMSIDYPEGDNKSGDAYNVSIYKMNVGMIRNIDRSVNPSDIHLDNKKATKVVISGIRKFGLDKFLIYHRGGESAFNSTSNGAEIMSYIEAIKTIAKKYKESPNQLNSYKTDDIRYTIKIPAI